MDKGGGQLCLQILRHSAIATITTIHYHHYYSTAKTTRIITVTANNNNNTVITKTMTVTSCVGHHEIRLAHVKTC